MAAFLHNGLKYSSALTDKTRKIIENFDSGIIFRIEN